MSNDVSSSITSSSQKPAWSWKIQNLSTPQTYAAKNLVESKAQSSSSSGVAYSQVSHANNASPVITGQAATTAQVPGAQQKERKRRKLDRAEMGLRNMLAEQVALNIQLDQLATLYPDTDTPFEDEIDVVKRLLPYHLYQIPKSDLDDMRGLKGKSKATELDLLKEEISDVRFALECHRRLRKLEKRFHREKIKPGKEPNPHCQVIALERMVLENDHSVTSELEQNLSSARSELDKITKLQRAARVSANKTTTTPAQTSTTPFYAYNSPAYSTAANPAFSSYYNTYAYPYGQNYIPGVGYTPTKPNTSSSLGTASFRVPLNGQNAVPSASSSVGAQPSTSFSATPIEGQRPPVAIPLQLPVSSLPALQALGILPVPRTSLPPPSEPQPAAVLLGSSSNGAMLSLEINASQLQGPQMSGLAVLLSNLVKLSGGTANAGAAMAQSPSTPSTANADANSTSN